MATTEEVKKLAALARIKIEDNKLGKFTSEFDAILAYVGQLEDFGTEGSTQHTDNIGNGALRNVMRDDDNANVTGEYAKKIVEQFPNSENGALSVKKIISHD